MSKRNLTILVIDENLVRAAILEAGLRDCGDFVIHHIREMDRLLSRVLAIDPDVILIDLENPSRDTLEEMFHLSRFANRPIAMFVDNSDSDAIEAGVSTYVVNGLQRERVKSILDITISRFNAFHKLQVELETAKSALDERKVIDRGKAILMRTKNISEQKAYELLRSTAMSQNQKIVAIARSLITAAELLNPGDSS